LITASQVTPAIAILPPVKVSTVSFDVAAKVCVDALIEQQIHHIRLARRLRKPQSVISAIEAGTRRVDIVEFLAVVRALRTDPVGIFGEIVRAVAGRGR
jgi:hypothetical protein